MFRLQRYGKTVEKIVKDSHYFSPQEWLWSKNSICLSAIALQAKHKKPYKLPIP
jgi:hypothetical protein